TDIMPTTFRFDLHVHSWFSADAADSPEKMVAAAKRRGLSGIAITDHDTCAAHAYCREKGLSREDGLPVDGFLVVPGVEVSTLDGHLLCVGTTLPDLSSCEAIEVCAEINRRGGIAIPAHPFDLWRSGIRSLVLDNLPIKVLEGFNSAATSKSFNQRAFAYARSRGLVTTAASDAHHASAVGVSHTALELPELSVAALVAQLPLGATPHGKYLSLREGFKKHFANFFRKKGAPKPDDI
ncbi:MAG: PHP domain-containing protein, partial [Terrimicrobiaceae bacterium]